MFVLFDFYGVSVPHVPFLREHGYKISPAHEDKEQEHEGIFRL